ncbi:hypothetical protein AVEN_108648-1 [Araneus ventricosus]|uniref:Uncharacterized protein n=1 Tax=Araneus ventricosus TaxID=182803 RepID=A0A4Y2IST5_ARAVE|nr:hypothetical protein AVEN_108648-1 [Araneus ventricosus]
MAAAIFMRVVSWYGKITMRYWMKPLTAPPGAFMTIRCRGKVEEFGEHIIGYGGFHEWPPRSPDLTPMDFFLWGYLKPSANIAGPSTTHYGCLCQIETHYAITCAT